MAMSMPNDPLVAVAALFIGSVAYAPAETNQSRPSESPTQPDISSPPSPQSEYVRPTTADNGVPFPLTSGYIDGYSMQSIDGYSKVIVDNSQNNSDVFVKLFTLDTSPPTPVRVFFILTGERFLVENLEPGNYDVRYRDLDSGRLARTSPFEVSELETLEGIEFSEITLTLYKVYGGNMKTYSISEDEF
jgi:hypothetical protein